LWIKNAGATVRAVGNVQAENAGLPNLKHYEIHLINAQDGLRCYVLDEKFKYTHRG